MNDEIASKLEILEEYTAILRGYQQHKTHLYGKTWSHLYQGAEYVRPHSK